MAAASSGVPLRALLVGTQDGSGTPTGVASGGARAPIDCSPYPYLTVYVVSSAALSAGTLVIEERDRLEDAPNAMSTVTLSTAFASAGGTYGVHLTPSAYGLISAKIGTSAVGGVVYAVLRAT